jgi:hypothetical protein
MSRRFFFERWNDLRARRILLGVLAPWEKYTPWRRMGG